MAHRQDWGARVVRSREVDEGEGTHVRRLLPSREVEALDPFVLVDDVRLDPPGFAEHGHRGFELLTYVVEGSLHHTDELGNDRQVGPGHAQLLVAGRGVVHAETPVEGESRLVQLWINLPRDAKGIDPSYRDAGGEDFPLDIEGGIEVRTIVGGAAPLATTGSSEVVVAEVPAGRVFERTVQDAWNGFLYVLDGSVRLAQATLGPGDALVIVGGDPVRVLADEDARLLFAQGEPWGEGGRVVGGRVD